MQPGDTNVTGLGLDYNKVANLYLKSSENDDVWQRLEFSVVDVSLNSFDRNLSMRWDSFTEYDISYGLINLPYIPEIDPIGYSGLYKVGKVPMQPFLTVQQPATNLYAALLTLNIVMTNNIITGPADFISRINFQELGIKAYFELKEDPENPLSQWELAVDPLGANPGVIYDLFLPQLTAGKKYIFRARLKNDYGYSW